MEKLMVSSSPHFNGGRTTQNIMLDVIIALCPAMIASVILFGLRAAVVILTCVASCILSEYLSRRVMKRPQTVGDLSCVVTGILLALYNRERTGQGQYVDIAMLDSVFAFIETNIVRHTIGGVHPTRVGARHPLSAPFDIYMCKDAHVIIAVASDHHFAKLCEIIGQPDLIKNPKFDSDPHRSENDVELKAILEKFFADYTVAEAMEMMQKESIPCGPLCTVDEACQNPSILQRDMLVEIDQPGMGKVKITGNPIKLSQTPPDPCHPAPLLGQDTQEVLRDVFGFSDEQIAKWKEENIV